MVSLIDAPKKAHSLPFLQKRFLHGLSPKKVGAQLLCTTKNCSFIYSRNETKKRQDMEEKNEVIEEKDDDYHQHEGDYKLKDVR